MPRNKRRNPATTITQFPGVNQSGMPVSGALDAHATTHEDGGSDPLSVLDLAGYSGNASDVLKGDASWGGVAGTGDVVGPASAVNNDVAVFDGVTGKLVKDSGVLISNVVVTSDARLSDARTPTAHHASHENGGADEMTVAGLNGVLADPQPPIIGAGATQAVAGNDARLTDARTPTAHAASHRSGGSDALVFDQTTSATGTQNNFSLNGPHTVLECSGAAPVFTGFTVGGVAPVGGDRAVLVYTGSGTLRVAKEDAGSTAANRITSPSARGQIVGVGGMITLVYESATSRWGVQAVQCGAPIPITFSAGNFTGAGSLTWTVDSGDVIANAFTQNGTTLTWFFSLSTTTLGGTTNTAVNLALPNGFTVANNGVQVGTAGRYLDTGSTWFALIFIANSATSTVLTLATLAAANLTLGTNTFYIQAFAIFLVD